MTTSTRRSAGGLAALVVAALLAGCAADPTEVAAAKGVVYRANIVLEEVETALQTTSARTVQEFVDDNSIAPADTRPQSVGELPWLNAVGASEAELDAHFPHSQPDYPRDITVLQISDPADPVGSVLLFVRTAGKNEVGFDPHPYKVFYACLDLTIDVDDRAVTTTSRSQCPDLPDALVALGKPLPESNAATGEAWPRG